jgi:hypothetical protein
MVKRLFLFLLLLLTPIFPIWALDLGTTFSTYSPLTGVTIIEKGSYVRTGLLAPVTRSIELEAAASVQVTPEPASHAILTTQFSFSLLSPAFDKDAVPLYVNTFLGAGFFTSAPHFSSYGPYITFTPLTMGGPEFLRKERLATISLMYDIPSHSFEASIQLFTIDFYRAMNSELTKQ